MEARQQENNFLSLLKKKGRGKLKIYIGMSAGVGKTYRMLQEAHALYKSGVDVVLGFIEHHNREETLALVAGLPNIARRTIFYKGKNLEEFDLQAALNRRPEVIIVDELAHSNIAGSKNEKRWQDIEELLEAGVSVITAVNIQHLESLNASVQRITSIEISERIPDKMLQDADEVVNIDLSANDLILRLKEGKIYKADKIEQALDNFFKEDSLLQLRELALREVARQVDRQIEEKVWQPKGFIIPKMALCISTNHNNARKMIRKVARLAGGDATEWWVIYVQTPAEGANQVKLSTQRHLLNNLKLATEMGAKVENLKSGNFAIAVFEFIRKQKIGLLILGRSERPWWKQYFFPGPEKKLMKITASYPVDFMIISSNEPEN